ncbi:MAG: hypothetical protein K2Q29_11865 [Sphingomonadales bacterium]|jgi:hypothetical protein|nr:hypothetical protein [Sphingomonadales bacterium]
MKWIVPAAAIFLAGCQSQGERAEAEYKVETSGFVTVDDKCRAARKVQQAYLSDQNEEKFRQWRLQADLYCNDAALSKL